MSDSQNAIFTDFNEEKKKAKTEKTVSKTMQNKRSAPFVVFDSIGNVERDDFFPLDVSESRRAG